MKRKDYQAIADLTSEALKIPTIKVRIKNVLGGRANKNYITLPKWLEHYDKEYQIYYVVHEVCHYLKPHVKGLLGHNKMFQKYEDKALELWGITIKRAKIYPKELYANGQRIKNIVKNKKED